MVSSEIKVRTIKDAIGNHSTNDGKVSVTDINVKEAVASIRLINESNILVCFIFTLSASLCFKLLSAARLQHFIIKFLRHFTDSLDINYHGAWC